MRVLARAYFQVFCNMAENKSAKRNRREEILQRHWRADAESGSDGSQRIVIRAKLAASVGVSEAALYRRHFPSKTRMFIALI